MNKGFDVEGEVRLNGALISGQLDFSEGQFNNPNKFALNGQGLTVKGNILLRKGFKANGEVSFIGARIDGCFTWTGVESQENMTLVLRTVRIGTLWDNKQSWPKEGKLFLDGLVYERLYEEAPQDADDRIRWLRLQPKDRFLPQPYEQLAEVFRKTGREADAKKILISKNKDRAEWGPKLTWTEWIWYRVFGPMIGYGHSPWRAFLIGLAIIVFGTLLFSFGFKNNLMAATKDAENASVAKFHALVYSIDMFVPLVDIYQAKYWLPDPELKAEWRPFNLSWFKVPVSGNVLRWYLWFHISIGWILTTLLVVGLTGLVRT